MRNPEQIARQMAKIRRVQIFDWWMPYIIIGAVVFIVVYALRLFGFRKLFKNINLPNHYAVIPFYRYYLLFEEYWDVKYFWVMLCGYIFVLLALLCKALLYLDFDWFQIPWLANPPFSTILLAIIILVTLGVLAVKFFLAKKICVAFNKTLPWAFAITFADFITFLLLEPIEQSRSLKGKHI